MKEKMIMLRQTTTVFLVLALFMGTASAQPKTKSKNGGEDGYPRPPMDVGVSLGAAIRGGPAFHASIEARARLEPWFGAGLSYEILYVDTYQTTSKGGGAVDHDDYAHRVLLMGRLYPGKRFVEGFFVGIGGGVEWLHTRKQGFDAMPQRECSGLDIHDPGPDPESCPIVSYTLDPVNVNQFLEPQAVFRISMGQEGAIGPVLCGAELAFDIPTGDEPDDKSVVSLRARVAYRF